MRRAHHGLVLGFASGWRELIGVAGLAAVGVSPSMTRAAAVWPLLRSVFTRRRLRVMVAVIAGCGLGAVLDDSRHPPRGRAER